MTDVDRLDLLARIGICFKIGAEGSFGVAAQGKGCFSCRHDLPSDERAFSLGPFRNVQLLIAAD